MLVPQPAEVSGFFETLCGPVAQLHVTRLDSQGTQVAFVEFASVLAADRALSCGGARLKVRAHAAGRFSYRLRCLPVAMHGGGHRTGLALTRVWRCRHCPFESARQRRRCSPHVPIRRPLLVCVLDGAACAVSSVSPVRAGNRRS